MKTPMKLPRVGLSVLFTFALFAGRVGDAGAAEDVPFIVTPDHVALAMLEIANVGPNDSLIDLGSGDGRIVILAAKRYGARGLGVEIVPDLVRQSRLHASSFASRTCSRPT
jgi:Histone methylation protein DOT1